MPDSNDNRYKCYNCGRMDHIVNGCKMMPLADHNCDKSRELRNIKSCFEATLWLANIMEHGISDSSEHYCMYLNDLGALYDEGCAVMGINTPGGV
jgi:hypothetical protein